MARYRLSGPAKADISSILRTSETQHGKDARISYRGLLTATMRRVAAEPQGRLTLDRGELLACLRSLHIRHSHCGHSPGHSFCPFCDEHGAVRNSSRSEMDRCP